MWGDTSLWFWFTFSWWLVTVSTFLCTCWLFGCLYVFFVKMSIQFLCSFKNQTFFFWLLSCMSYLYILDIVCCSPICLHLLLLTLIWSRIQKILPVPMSRHLPTLFSSRSFMVSFKSNSQIFNPFWGDFCVWCKIGV